MLFVHYTKADLLVAAKTAGFRELSARLIDDWVAKGLLDQPDKSPGLGRGKGRAPGTWPEYQRELFLGLLGLRSELKKTSGRSRVLPNIPVAEWLYRSDKYVPLRQVRRALATYCEAVGASSRPARKSHWSARSPAVSHQRAEATARYLVRLFAPADLPRDKRLKAQQDLANEEAWLARGGAFDRAQLIKIARSIIDPDGTGRTVGVAPRPFTAEEWADMVEAWHIATEGLATIGDHTFEHSRTVLRQQAVHYPRERPELAKDPELGKTFPPIDRQMLVMEACRHLIFTVGALERHAAQRVTDS